MLTSSSEERDLVESYALGANAYVVKPVEFHQFLKAVKELGVFWGVINEPPRKAPESPPRNLSDFTVISARTLVEIPYVCCILRTISSRRRAHRDHFGRVGLPATLTESILVPFVDALRQGGSTSSSRLLLARF